LNAMEINILPKRFTTEVRGMSPFLRPDNTLDCVQTGTLGPIQAGMTEILDFGNLCNTSILSDLKEVASVVANPGSQLSSYMVFIDQVGLWLVGILQNGNLAVYPSATAIGDSVESVFGDFAFGNVLEALKTTNSSKAKEFTDAITQIGKIWTPNINLIKWFMIGAGVLVVGGVVSVAAGLWNRPAASVMGRKR